MSTIETASPIEKKVSEKKSFLEKADDAVDILRRNRSLFELKRSGATTKQAIETTALDLSESDDQNLTESEKNLFGVIAHLGSFVTSDRVIEEIIEESEGQRLSRDDYDEVAYRKTHDLIPFNHALKELINTDSSSTKDQLDAGLTRLYMRLYYPDDPLVRQADVYDMHDQKLMRQISGDVLARISNNSNGMRHEIAAESMLAALGYHYEYEISPEEDSHGIDMYVYIDDAWVSIDVKSTQMSAEKELTKRKKSHAVWTGLEQADFKGAKGDQVNGTRIPFDIAYSHADSFVNRIRAVAQR